MKFTNKIIISLLFLLLFNISFANAEGIYINNKKIPSSTPVLIKNDKAFIAVSDISYLLGGVLSWDNSSKSATVTTDNLTLKFTNNAHLMELNGDKINIELAPLMNNGKLMAPATILRDYLNFKINWNYKTRDFTLSSQENTDDTLIDEIKFSQKNYLTKIQNIISDNSISFTYASTDDVKNEKYLPDGKYFIFKAGEKGNITKGLNGYFYMNVYTEDVYFYPVESAHDGVGIKKYKNGQEVDNFIKNGKNTVHSLIAVTHMVNDIKDSDNSLSGFSYTKKEKINKEYLKHIPKAEYYYYQASKKENNTLKPQFEIAQNSDTLDVYIFLKKENGINIVKLPNELVKTIELISKK